MPILGQSRPEDSHDSHDATLVDGYEASEVRVHGPVFKEVTAPYLVTRLVVVLVMGVHLIQLIGDVLTRKVLFLSGVPETFFQMNGRPSHDCHSAAKDLFVQLLYDTFGQEATKATNTKINTCTHH